MDVGDLAPESFAPHVGTVFTVHVGDDTLALKLEEVTDQSRLMESATLPDGTNLYKRVPFSIAFSGPKEPILQSGIHRLSHPELGSIEIFLKPYIQSDQATFYEAVFN